MTRRRGRLILVLLVMSIGRLVPALADEVGDQLEAGRSYLQKGDFQKAANTFHQVIMKHKGGLEGHPRHADVWEGFGQALKGLGKQELSGKAMKRAAAIREQEQRASAPPSEPSPTEPAAAPDSGDEVTLQPAPAATPAVGATGGSGQKPEDPEVAKARKLLYAAKPDFAGAKKILEGILAKEPNHCQALTGLGEMLLLQGKPQEAIKKFEQARKADGGDVRPIMGLGDSYLALRQPEKAVDLFRLAWAMEPFYYAAQAKLGRALIQAKRTQEGSHLLGQAIQKDPNNLDARLELVALQLANANDMSASEHLEKCLQLAPQDPRVQYYRGMWLEMRKLLPKAMKELYWASLGGGEIGLKAKVHLADIYSGIGHFFPGNPFSNDTPDGKNTYKVYTNPEKAMRLYQEVLAINPNHPDAARIQTWLDEHSDDIGAAHALEEKIQGRFRTR